jgi:hypothetical protein
MISTLIAAAAVVATLHGGVPADAAGDAVFPVIVRDALEAPHKGISDAMLRGLGHGMCSDLDNGMSKSQVVVSALVGYNGTPYGQVFPLSGYEAGFILGASTAAYCPQHIADPYV